MSGTLPDPEDSKPTSIDDWTRPPLVVYQVDTPSMAQVKPDLSPTKAHKTKGNSCRCFLRLSSFSAYLITETTAPFIT